MIVAKFFTDDKDKLVGFDVTGHAGLADHGSDVCCASVSSAVMMTANTISEAFKLKADVKVEENDISLMLDDDDSGNGDRILLGFLTHMYFLAEEFSGHIKVKVEAR